MEQLARTNEYNITEAEIATFPIKRKVRAAVFLDTDTLMCLEENYEGRMLLGLPGGTIDENEGDREALIREVKEETGCDVKSCKEIGTIEIVRKSYRSVTVCYIAEATEGGGATLTSREIEAQTRHFAISFEDAYLKMKKEYTEFPNDRTLRSLLILEKIKNDR